MTHIAAAIAAAVSLTIAILGSAAPRAYAVGANGSLQNPCAVPNEVSSSIEETAWQIWVAATCPVNNNQYPFVVWENWIEQAAVVSLPTHRRSQGAELRGRDGPTATHGCTRARSPWR